jgi:transposase
MHKLTVSDVRGLKAALHQAVLRTSETRFLHRMHAVLLVALGNSCYRVAKWFGEDPRTVERWVRRFEESGAAALRNEHKSGRPARLGPQLAETLSELVANSPRDVGYALARWSGRLLKAHLQQRLGIALSVRQCQRLLRQLPRPARPRSET